MKKLKIIKCLASLLGLSITLGTITPIIASCSDNSTSNDSNNESNDNNQDSNQPGNGGDTSGPGNDNSGGNGDSGSGGGSDNPSDPDNGGNPGGGSGDSGGTTPPTPTIPAYKEQWLKDKQVENQNILNNLVWLYNYQSFENLDKIINYIVGISNSNSLINSGTGGTELGLYPYIKCSTNQYTPVSEWFSPISSNPSLKDKVFKMDYYIPEVKVAEIPKNASTDTSYVNTYKLFVNELTLCDATLDFSSGDLRTLVSSKNTTSSKNEIVNISRPHPQSIKNILQKYQDIVTNSKTTIAQIKTFFEAISKIVVTSPSMSKTANAGSTPIFAEVVNKFAEFNPINQNNVDALNKHLDEANPEVFSLVKQTLEKLFNFDQTTNQLFKVAKEINDSLTKIKETYKEKPNQKNSITLPITNKDIQNIANKIQDVLQSMLTYYLNFAKELFTLVNNCLPTKLK